MVAGNLPPIVELRVRRLWVVIGWLLVLFVVYESLTPAPIDLEIEQGDKFGHVLAYLVLMSWFANLYENRTQRIGFAFGFVALGIGLEFVQRSTGYRSFEIADMAAGIAGVAIGWVLAPPRVHNVFYVMERAWRT